MRFAKKDIYVTQDDRRFVAAFAGQPIPAHLDHLVDAKDTTDTPPAPTADLQETPPAPPEVEAVPVGEASDEVLIDQFIEIARELGTRDPDEDLIEAKRAEMEGVLNPLGEGGEEAGLDYGKLKKGQLEDLIERRHKVLSEIEGSGSDGNVVTEDLVKALETADAVTVDE